MTVQIPTTEQVRANSKRKLWLDTRGEPVITTTANGVKNALRWGWVEAVAVGDLAEHDRQVAEKAIDALVEVTEERRKRYVARANRLHDEGERADSERYYGYASGLDMVPGAALKAKRAYREGGENV